MLLHSIGRGDGRAHQCLDPQIYFPRRLCPGAERNTAGNRRSGLIVTDVEVLRLHYAKTLSEWQQRFQANRAEIATLYDERFCRMWEFYLAGPRWRSAMSNRWYSRFRWPGVWMRCPSPAII